jgi:glutathione S-transferase
MALTLVIGNKNYSSWSLRPWLLMVERRIRFEEQRLRLDFSEGSPFRDALAKITPAGRVPVLLDDGFAVWDSLAIVETLAEKFPQAGVWPRDARARARARSVSAEMHSGFGALRRHCPMNVEARLPEAGRQVWAAQADVRADLQRIDALWCDALRGSGGPFLFGEFCAADAFYAPVALRVRTYALPLSAAAQAYADRLLDTEGARRWIAEALAEHDFLAEDEPYRPAP